MPVGKEGWNYSPAVLSVQHSSEFQHTECSTVGTRVF